MYIKRDIEERVKKINETFLVMLVTGPRQAGKTTILRELSEKNRKYVTLDDFANRQLAKEDPKTFLSKYKPPVIIDEVQYAPELFSYIKMYVDEKKEYGKIWLTGSQAFHMMKNVSDSLAGRVGIIQLYGLSNSEIKGYENEIFTLDFDELIKREEKRKIMDLSETYEMIFRGSKPVLYVNEKIERDDFYASYINTYITRDIRDLTQVADENTFYKFLTVVAARTSKELNYKDISNEIGVTEPTVKQWVSVLISSGIVYLLEPYYNNRIKRAIKTPRLYFMDTGLCAYLTKWSDKEVLEAGAMSGAFFETWVVSELVKNYYNSGKRPPFYYYRDKDGKEIDLIIEQNGTLYPIEIKKSGTPKRNAIKHFSVLEKTDMKVGSGGVICLTDKLIPIDEKNSFIPAWMI